MMIITARIRRMREGNSFTLSTPRLGEGGTPFPGPGRGAGVLPHPGQIPGRVGVGGRGRAGVPPIQIRSQVGGWGYPHPGQIPGWGTGWGGIGYPPIQVRSQDGGGGGRGPLPEQHSVYLLRGGRYASCVHAGGLSCIILWVYSLAVTVLLRQTMRDCQCLFYHFTCCCCQLADFLYFRY